MEMIINLAKQFIEDVDGNGKIELPDAISALMGLLSGPDSNLDIAGLMGKVQSLGLDSVLSSWLGSGENEAISGGQIQQLFGEDKIASFCEQLNIDSEVAQQALSKLIPMFIDQSSADGGIADLLGGNAGLEGLGNALGGFLK